MNWYKYRQDLAEKLVEALENGVAPWQRPWTLAGAPVNTVSGTRYKGYNAMKLIFQSYLCGYWDDPRWCTFRQAEQQGWRIKKGAKGVHIEFYTVREPIGIHISKGSILFVEPKAFDSEYDPHRFGEGLIFGDISGEKRTYVIIKNYVVFHASQIEGIDPFEPPCINKNEKAERIIQDSRAEIRYGGLIAYYNPVKDYIRVPARWRFGSQQGYYATIFHELAHWTGHLDRLNRRISSSDVDSYAREELVAEIASMFLSAETGIPQTQELINNHAAYISSWIREIKPDPYIIFRAVSMAQKASDELLKYEYVRERRE